MLVRDIMSRHVATVDEGQPLSLALQMMLWSGARHLPVLHDHRLVGVLSERDILRYQASSNDPQAMRMPVKEAMSAPAKYVHPETSLSEAAARLAEDKIGCLPVVEQGVLKGIVTTTDFLTHQVRTTLEAPPAEHLSARDIMTVDPLTGAADDLVVDAVARMATANVRHLPVIDGERRVVGILSDRDIQPAAVSDPRLMESLRVAAVMSRDVLTLEEDAPLSLVLAAFTNWRMSAMPIVDKQERLVGIISYVDVVRALSTRGP